MLQHLAAVWERTGGEPARLRDAPELPAMLEPLWADFIELHNSRGSTGFGAAPITFADIDAWQRVVGLHLRPWEIAAIRAADNAYFAAMPKPKGSGQ